jgi:hypothetical protein
VTTPSPNKSLRAIPINSIGTCGRRKAAPGSFDFDFSHNAVVACARALPAAVAKLRR